MRRNQYPNSLHTFLVIKNISKAEEESIDTLASRADIVVKKSDKGSATVVVSSDWYENEAKRQLNDQEFYKKVDTDDTEKHESIIQDTLKGFVESKIISKKLDHVEFASKS